ncbi:MAG TPA: diguanylate cyclase [Vicinamibacterales bacterium]|jgi:diguanylate cyclase (GGDEF)-like protein
MRVFGRQDRRLLVGLVIALIVLIARPVQQFLDIAHDVDHVLGLSLLPAFVVLTVVLILHWQAKSYEAKSAGQTAEARAQHSRTTTSQIERLATYGQLLERAADIETIRDAAAQHLPKLTESDDVWVLTREEQGWRALNGTTTAGRADLEQTHAQIAERALKGDPLTAAKPIEADGHFCVPLLGGGEIAGVLGVPESSGPITNLRQRMIAAVAVLTGLALRNAQLVQHLRHHAVRDPLTGCLTRGYGLDQIDVELRRARRSQMPVSLIMFDIDHLKTINERRGFACGDAVLRALGARLHELLRGSDIRCRYGGEEFVVLLPETPLEGARRVADTLRKEIADLNVVWQDELVTATASFGVTIALPGEVDAQAIIARAEAALDRAKDQGTNSVRLIGEPIVA